MEELNIIKEKIRTINPNFTDELLDLLYEYVTKKFSNRLLTQMGLYED